MSKVPAENFIGTLRANVDNKKLTDKAFREFVRNPLTVVEGGQESAPEVHPCDR